MKRIVLLFLNVVFFFSLLGCTQIIVQTGVSPSETDSSDVLIPADISSGESESSSAPVSEETDSESAVPSESAAGELTSSGESESYEEVDLGIDMPEPNGTMQVSSDAENKYIKTVISDRGIDPALLCAVYSVPESGQNYVFEFYSAGERSANNIRRVFFINSNGKIESVAASKTNERENISPTENWFSMNVLIKQLIFPAVKDQM